MASRQMTNSQTLCHNFVCVAPLLRGVATTKKNCAGTIVGRMKREDVAPVGDNGESADDEQPDALSQLRLRRTVYTVGRDSKGNQAETIVGRMKRTVITTGVDSQGNRAGTIVGRMKREDVAPLGDNGESADDEQPDALSQLRLRRTVITAGVDSQGNRAGTIVGRMKRESNNCLWQCVCTTVHGGNAGVQDASSSGSRGTRGIGSWAGSNRGEALSTTVTSGRCVTESQDCRSVETC